MMQLCYVIGINRSGTTLLHSLLASHSAIYATSYEDGMITGLARAGAEFQAAFREKDLLPLLKVLHSRTEYLTLLIHSLTGEIRPEGQWGGQHKKVHIDFDFASFDRAFMEAITQPERRTKLAVSSMAELLPLFYATLARYRGAGGETVVASKPGKGAHILLQALPYHGDLCPVLLCIQRDPRAVISSHLKKYPSQSIARLIDEWRRDQHALETLRRSGRYPLKVIRYEDLCEAPEQVMAEVAALLNIPFEQSLVHPQIAGEDFAGNSSYGVQFEGVSQESTDRWKSHLSPQQVREIERRAGWLMQAAGYPLMTPPQPLGWALERAAGSLRAARAQARQRLPLVNQKPRIIP